MSGFSKFGFEGGGAGAAAGGGIKQDFTATAGQTVFPFTEGTLTDNCYVQIGGITINPALWTRSGDVITLLDAVEAGTWVTIVQLST